MKFGSHRRTVAPALGLTFTPVTKPIYRRAYHNLRTPYSPPLSFGRGIAVCSIRTSTALLSRGSSSASLPYPTATTCHDLQCFAFANIDQIARCFKIRFLFLLPPLYTCRRGTSSFSATVSPRLMQGSQGQKLVNRYCRSSSVALLL